MSDSEDSQSDFAKGFDEAASGNLNPTAQMAITQLTEACPTKSVLALTAGFALGGVFGMFMSSMDMSSQMEFEKYQNMSTREQIRHTLRDMGSRSYATAKNFAIVGAVFAGSECVIESVRLFLLNRVLSWITKSNAGDVDVLTSNFYLFVTGFRKQYRAKNDIYNGVTAGCFTGAALAARGGPKAMATGCVGFAAFSAAIGTPSAFLLKQLLNLLFL
ncbi:mitochondrial import inner membrane translocase subunit Tim22 [Chytriomyces cf. hyalinus JEL632]|nr:mitochondrial import inner membrane translocase subunit Tim22 [Chytriomyces cf. hyalinus JEL632]